MEQDCESMISYWTHGRIAPSAIPIVVIHEGPISLALEEGEVRIELANDAGLVVVAGEESIEITQDATELTVELSVDSDITVEVDDGHQ